MSAATSILIVEDERIVAQDLQQSLVEMGYDAFAIASSADEALRCATSRRPDVVLMDIRIKGKRDGIETAEALRTTFGVPVVYLTAHADDATIERAKKTQPYGYLVKPVRSSELRSVLEVSVHRHAADRQLRERERWFSTTLRSIADAVVTVDVDGNVSFMNTVAEELVGMRSADSIGRPNAEVVRIRPPRRSPLDAALAQKVPIRLDEATLERGDAQVLISDSAAPVLDGAEVLGAVMVFRDISERREAQRRLEFADRLSSLGTMAAGVAHEVNNPLSVISASSQLLRGEVERVLEDTAADGPTSETLRDLLRHSLEVHAEIQSAAGRIARIVADLRAFTRPREPGSGPASVREAIDLAVRVTAHERSQRARTVLDVDPVPPAAIDETRLGQVLVNLLTNAALALPSGSPMENEIKLTARVTSPTRVTIEVRDTGVGMTPETLGRIFEPFFTTRSQGSGTGLGLAISRSIVTSVGGEITATSEVGVGTTFRVVLPVAVVSPVAPEQRTSAGPRARGRVLVVDDDELVLRVIRRVLSGEHEVVCCTSARAALQLFASGERFDVILSDLVMPELSGPAFFEELRRHMPGEHAKVVFMTGGVTSGGDADFLSRLPNRRLDKPFDVAKLRMLVQEQLAERLT